MGRKISPLQIVNPNAAGIDVGSRTHMVAVDQIKDNVREFGIYTKDHELLIDHLRNYGITTVAMESTGTYWQTLFSALQRAGFEVLLVNGNQTKNVKGRKTDVIDCMWIQRLHSLGLLSGSFLLSDVVQELRIYYNHRQHLIEQSAKYINKIQKSLRLMNIRLDVTIRDIASKSGLAIVEAIINGHRNPEYLASLVDIRVKKTQQEIADSLNGLWRDELLFELKTSLEFYKTYQKAMFDCDVVIEQVLIKYAPKIDITPSQEKILKQNKKKRGKNSPEFNVSQIAFQYFKTDLFSISGMSNSSILCLLTNMGNDLNKFHSAKSFAAWLRLTPNNKISGGKVISSRTPSGKNLIARTLRQAANSIGNQKDHELTPFFNRIAFKKGRIVAITATARKLAIIIWNMIVKEESYRKHEAKMSDEKLKMVKLRQIEKRISTLKLSKEELNSFLLRNTMSTV